MLRFREGDVWFKMEKTRQEEGIDLNLGGPNQFVGYKDEAGTRAG
jgi:hypothetical protein